MDRLLTRDSPLFKRINSKYFGEHICNSHLEELCEAQDVKTLKKVGAKLQGISNEADDLRTLERMLLEFTKALLQGEMPE